MGIWHCHFSVGVWDCHGLHSNKSILPKQKLTGLLHMLKKSHSAHSAWKFGTVSLLLEPGALWSSAFEDFRNSREMIAEHYQFSVRQPTQIQEESSQSCETFPPESRCGLLFQGAQLSSYVQEVSVALFCNSLTILLQEQIPISLSLHSLSVD